MFGAGAALCYLGYRTTLPTRPVAQPRLSASAPPSATPPATGNPFGADTASILLVGTDGKESPGRTDTMILLCVDLTHDRLAAVSIPRDTRVRLGSHGLHKINAAFGLGGQQLLAQSVADLTGQPVDHLVRLDLDGFQQVVDAVGGVRLKVEKSMQYTDHAQHLKIDLRPGEQLLDGVHAMQFVRFRKDAEGDLGRMRRQQQFLRALAAAATKARNVPRLPNALRQLNGHVHTTLTTLQTARLLRLLQKTDLSSVPSLQLPGAPRTVDRTSYFIAAPDAAAAVTRLRQSLANPDSGTAAPGAARADQLLPDVTVYNGSDRVGLERVIVARLRRHGCYATVSPKATVPQTKRTRVYSPQGDSAACARVAALLGLATPVGSGEQAAATQPRPGVPQVVVVLGADCPSR